MPRQLKNKEGLTPGALKIINTPTCELLYTLKHSSGKDIVAAHLAMRRECLFPAKQRVICKYISGYETEEIETDKNGVDKLFRTSWYKSFSAEWEKTCNIFHAIKKGEQQ